MDQHPLNLPTFWMLHKDYLFSCFTNRWYEFLVGHANCFCKLVFLYSAANTLSLDAGNVLVLIFEYITYTTWFPLKEKKKENQTNNNTVLHYCRESLFYLAWHIILLQRKVAASRRYSKWNRSSTPESYLQLCTYPHLSLLFSSNYFPW